MQPSISADEIYDAITKQCRDAAAAGQRGHCIFDPALLEADGAAAALTINPPRPASSQFSARVFVNTDPAKPASYAPADMYYITSGSPLCGKEVFRERVEPGFYIEAQPGRRFAVVVEEHFGPLKAIASETNKFTVFISPLRRHTKIFDAGKRCIILGDLRESGEKENPFVFEVLDSELEMMGSASNFVSASSSSSASSAKPGSFQVGFMKAVPKARPNPNAAGQQQPKKGADDKQLELGKRAEEQQEQARKRAKILGGLASVDTHTSLANKTPLIFSKYTANPSDRLCTLTVRYRSRLWMMVAGLRPTSSRSPRRRRPRTRPAQSAAAPRAPAPEAAAAAKRALEAAAAAAAVRRRLHYESVGSGGSGGGSSSAASASSGADADAGGRFNGGPSAGAPIDISSLVKREDGAGGDVDVDVRATHPPPIDVDDPATYTGLPDLDLDREAALEAPAALPGRFYRLGAPAAAVDVALAVSACATAEALLAAAAAHPRVGPPPPATASSSPSFAAMTARFALPARPASPAPPAPSRSDHDGGVGRGAAGLRPETFRRWRDKATEVLILLAPAGL
eukprot:tig00021098_g18188.t1